MLEVNSETHSNSRRFSTIPWNKLLYKFTGFSLFFHKPVNPALLDLSFPRFLPGHSVRIRPAPMPTEVSAPDCRPHPRRRSRF